MRPALTRRSVLLLGAACLATPAHAQPDRTARIVVGAAPGGGTDTVARLLAERLAGSYAPQVIVENRTGASSRLAAEAVKGAAPDGATMLFGPMPVLTLFPHVLPRTTRYDPVTDFTAVATVGEVAYGLAVKADHPARNLAEFLAGAAAKGSVTFAPAVLGSPQHMLGLELAKAGGATFEVIAYRTNGQAMQDLLAGRIESFMSHMAELAPQLRAGRIRLLAVSSGGRLPGFPEASTFAEQGFPQFTGGEASVVVLPAQEPDRVSAAPHAAIAAAVADPTLRERLKRLEITPMVLSPAETAARIRAESATWRRIVQASGFNAEE